MDPLVTSWLNYLVSLILGLALLLYGRRLFWVLGGLGIGIAGFLLATFLLEREAFQMRPLERGIYFDVNPTNAMVPIIAVGIVAGVLGIALTIRFPKVASAIVGFISGWVLLFLIFTLFSFQTIEWVQRSLLVIAGTLVAVLAVRQPAETMIILSTLIGAIAIVEDARIDLNSPWSAYAWLILMLVGIIFQTKGFRTQQRREAVRRAEQSAPPA